MCSQEICQLRLKQLNVNFIVLFWPTFLSSHPTHTQKRTYTERQSKWLAKYKLPLYPITIQVRVSKSKGMIINTSTRCLTMTSRNHYSLSTQSYSSGLLFIMYIFFLHIIFHVFVEISSQSQHVNKIFSLIQFSFFCVCFCCYCYCCLD